MTMKKNIGELKSSPLTNKIAGVVISALFAGASLFSFSSDDAKAEAQKQIHVLELFTSQGCSSCPPADALLDKLADRDDVVALSFPVSYWDYLGWKDTLAKEEFNARQYAYADSRGDRDIYTPQMIVNGVTHVVGSRPGDVQTAIDRTASALADVRVDMSAKIKFGKVVVNVGDAPEGSKLRSGKVWVVCYSRSVEVPIGSGENHGRRISYTNVARELIPAGRWDGTISQYTVDIPVDMPYDGVAVLLQAADSNAMLGAVAASASP